MKQRLFIKYFLAIGLTMLLSITVLMMILTVVYNSYLADSKYNTMQKSCVSVSDFMERNQDGFGNVGIGMGTHYIITNLTDVSDFDVYVTDNAGVIIICGCEEWGRHQTCEHIGTQLSGDVVEKAVKDDYKGISTLGVYKEPRYVTSAKVNMSRKNSAAYVVAAAPMSELWDLLRQTSRIYIIAAIVPLVIMFIALYIITYRLTRPLKLMSNAAKAMAHGDFSKRIPVTTDDEIGELAVSFNQMTNSLSRLEGMRKSFVADVSHELKTPMTTIGGFIDGIIDGTIDEDKQKYYLGIVSSEIKRLSRMVESMLSLSKLESDEFVLKTEKFDFRELLLSVVVSQEQRIEQKQINIIGLEDISSATVNADKDLLYRVIYNLCDNAIKFTDEGGIISFAMGVDTKNLTFEIKNSGKGIPKSELPYVFERFYKVDKSRSANKDSTGLGLYIVKMIIKKHDGTINVASKENEFTAFAITLPLSK